MEAVMEKPKPRQKKKKAVEAKAVGIEGSADPTLDVSQKSAESSSVLPVQGVRVEDESTMKPLDIAEAATLPVSPAKPKQSIASSIPEKAKICTSAPEKAKITSPISETAKIATTIPETAPKTNSIPEDSFQRLLNASKDLIKGVQLNEAKHEAEAKTKQKERILPAILPYSEAQLAAFYTNNELVEERQFTNQFVEAELKGFASKRHPLYGLLENYLAARSKVTGISVDFDEYRREYAKVCSEIWSLEDATVTGRGTCSDGVQVTAKHTYVKSTFHRSTFQTVERTLGQIRKITNDTHLHYSYLYEISKLQIKLYLQSLNLFCINRAGLDRTSPVCLSFQKYPPDLEAILRDVRLCISVLFSFQRRQLVDSIFNQQLQEWLSQLVTLLLRMATWQDHMFILNHVLRCPAEVGKWAAHYIQVPMSATLEDSPFSSCFVNHLVTVFSVILNPIFQREQFLEQFKQEVGEDASFIIIGNDSDDEDLESTSLRQSDLVMLLDQIPFDALFKQLLMITRQNDKYVFDINRIANSHVLKFFSFSTVLLNILIQGLKTYSEVKYNYFTKRLCVLVKHVIQYATELWETFKAANLEHHDRAMLERLQVEYDAFMIRTTTCLFKSQKCGGFAFLADLPYDVISLTALWKIFYVLHGDLQMAKCDLPDTYTMRLQDDIFRAQFEDKLAKYKGDESCYLLSALSKMILDRGIDDMEFIEFATMDLMQVGFISELTRESCARDVSLSLGRIASKYPQLLSNIIKCIKLKSKVIGSFSLHNLFNELPLGIWKPTEIDRDTIISWLTMHNYSSAEARWARMILARLNWDLEEGTRQLYLPHEFHFRVALILANVADEDPSYLEWAWKLAFKLHLHYNDKGLADLARLSDLNSHDVLNRGVRERKPFACFLGLLMTSCGHLVPIVFSHGFAMIEIVLTCQRYEAVLFLLRVLMPLFLDCQETLVNSERFQGILMALINVDRSYLNMAKSLVISQTEVVKLFGNMINHQIDNFRFYNLDSSKDLARLWTSALVSIPNWNRDSGVLYLLDVIVRSCFFDVAASNSVVNILRDLLQAGTPQETGFKITSLLKWGSVPQDSLLTASSLPAHPWLAYVLISLEYEERECKTGLWKEILNQLNRQVMSNRKVSVDAAIKKASSLLKLHSFTSASLCIYRWAQQAHDTDLSHPLLTLLWQKFFTLYLTRIPVSSTAQKSCLGQKFFDGIVNLAFFKQLKKRLQETVEFYSKKTENCDDSELEESLVDRNDKTLVNREHETLADKKKQYYRNCVKIFRAYSLWLEESLVQDNHLHLPSLPAQYEASYLNMIIEGSEAPWSEFIDVVGLQEQKSADIELWLNSICRSERRRNKTKENRSRKSLSSADRMLERMRMYDTPKPPPELVKSAPLLPPVKVTNVSLIKELEEQLQQLHLFANNHTYLVSDYKNLDSHYLELVKEQYTSVLNKSVKKVSCKGQGKVGCAGQAVIQLEMNEAHLNSNIDHQIQVNRSNYEALIGKSMQSPPDSLCRAAVSIQKAIEQLANEVKCNTASPDAGVELFYHLLSKFTDEIKAFPPTKHFFLYCLEQLGQNFIYGVDIQTPCLLKEILKNHSSLDLLAPHFSPLNSGTATFLYMYSTICNESAQKYDVIYQLLPKFDISNWLLTKQPKVVDRVKFINLVMRGLTALGFTPTAASLAVHEIYRAHLVHIYEYQFPEHHLDLIKGLLDVSQGGPDGESISIMVWVDIFYSLSTPIRVKLSAPVAFRKYAEKQKKLTYEQAVKTAVVLATYFNTQRSQYGLYGLYPKYKNYVETFTVLVGMIGHVLVYNSLVTHQGVSGEKVVETLWNFLRPMFEPWIAPCWKLTDMSYWVQQLADDRNVLMPYKPADGPSAQKMFQMLSDCLQFLNHTIPGSNSILNHVWAWYMTYFAHVPVKEHVLNEIHAAFICLPWNNFWPSVNDVEAMSRLVDQYLPECHTFLGHIFFQIPWLQWIRSVHANEEAIVKVHRCLLNLLVKLSKEPTVRSSYREQGVSLLLQAASFNWDILEPGVYQHILDWYVMSCDPLVLFLSDPAELDFQVLNFLRVAGHYHKALEFPDEKLLHKRHIYVRSYVKLVNNLASKCKTTLATKTEQLCISIRSSLAHMEIVVKLEPEFVVLLKEMFGLLNLLVVKQNCITCFEFFHTKPGDGIVLRAVLQSLGAVSENNIAANFYENAIFTYFFSSNLENGQNSWRNLAGLLQPYAPQQPALEQILVSQGHILTLNALLIKKIASCDTSNCVNVMNSIFQWLQDLKINSSREDKVPLLWHQLLSLAQTNCERNEREVAILLQKFSQLLLQLAAEKGVGGWGKRFLGALGIVKQDSATLKFKFLCRATAGYLLAQLPDPKGQSRKVRNVSNAPGTVGQPGGNTDCVKALLGLDFGEKQGEIKTYAATALKMIQDSNNSLHNVQEFLALLVNQIYTQPYLRDIVSK